MEELKKMLDAVSLQLVIVIVIGIVSIVIQSSLYSDISTFNELVAVSSSPLSILVMILGFVNFVVIGWAGYVWVKETKGTAVDGGKAGALVSAISGAISSVLSIIYVMPVITKFTPATATFQITPVIMVIIFVAGVIAAAIAGFILGLIGGAFAKR